MRVWRPSWGKRSDRLRTKHAHWNKNLKPHNPHASPSPSPTTGSPRTPNFQSNKYQSTSNNCNTYKTNSGRRRERRTKTSSKWPKQPLSSSSDWRCNRLNTMRSLSGWMRMRRGSAKSTSGWETSSNSTGEWWTKKCTKKKTNFRISEPGCVCPPTPLSPTSTTSNSNTKASSNPNENAIKCKCNNCQPKWPPCPKSTKSTCRKALSTSTSKTNSPVWGKSWGNPFTCPRESTISGGSRKPSTKMPMNSSGAWLTIDSE